MARVLDNAEITERMSDARLKDWRREGDTLSRTVEAHDFPTAVRIVDKVVVDAQKLDQHPDIDIRDKTVRFVVHSDRGLTDVDLELAQRIETAAGSYTRGHA
ncbi:4a-hydroxytetrahydrobiopterin dehydratase [Streptantibioticus rubrisoli]|uniref:Putative pterin-4-alpha-carbinolamine dehydratase n=1 Tax=Streptantibioticus rubrisoli TaxID=1387313 RepID=A0ABT1PEG4_9ACTN|nr:4a-hydroxytetrahydrobiopterin dehydratase [Streptantibioticus rubrisoli]MCQ4043763.1 4a-hydroxytetrahydrobiopterin dehydratase [Streptantibioticus rubrisoli]